MKETARKFARTNASTMQVEQYFRARLKHNYAMGIPGGSVTFNAMKYRGTPTNYKSDY